MRNPAAFCGVTALRPSPGLISRSGVTPVSPTFDVVGLLAREASVLRRLMEAQLGRTDRSAPAGIKGHRFGVPTRFFLDDLDAAVARAWDELIDTLSTLGARLVPIEIPGAKATPEALNVLLNREASLVHQDRFTDERLDSGIRKRLTLGARTPRRVSDAASRLAARWQRAVADAFGRVDTLLTPTTPFVAPPIADTDLVEVSRQINRLTSPWSLALVPALTLPLAAGALPVGGQFIAPRLADAALLRLAEALQKRTGWHLRQPTETGASAL